jgi:hypothetical protein
MSRQPVPASRHIGNDSCSALQLPSSSRMTGYWEVNRCERTLRLRALAMVRYPPATSELLRRHPLPMIKKHMRIPLVHFDCRLVVLSSFIVIIAAYVTLAVVERMKTAQGIAWFAWLGGGASGIGVGIWLMHYFGWRALTMTVPTLERSSVICSILATIFISGLTLLVVSGKSDSGRRVKEENQCPMRPEIFIRI